ncbi:Alpha/Beta hydrolase protein [Gongronella butleri]|nr:Alpha/Beta hydrolase protein [Gongronella butleri]
MQKIRKRDGLGQIRFKQPEYCDSTVVQYSGYIDLASGQHYFFWFFESRHDPASDSFTLWLQGGPGCSALGSLFTEVGPCRVDSSGQEATFNDYTWTHATNILFLDQPAGTGFSKGTRVNTTTDAVELIYESLQLFMDVFPKYRNLRFNLFGESFAGHFLPALGSYIMDRNSPGNPANLNLAAMGIGNGIVDVLNQLPFDETMACQSDYGSVLTPAQCQSMVNNTPACEALLQTCDTTGAIDDCVKATNFCADNVEQVYNKYANRSIYDIRTNKSLPLYYTKFITKPDVMESINADGHFIPCRTSIRKQFYATGDYARRFSPDVAKMLNAGIPVLIYAGDADYRANWYGCLGWTNALQFNGAAEYQAQQLRPWYVNGAEAGETKSAGGLTFVKVSGAGHKVPAYKPAEALAMFTSFIDNQPM